MDPISSSGLVTNDSELESSEEVIFDDYSVMDDTVLSTENVPSIFFKLFLLRFYFFYSSSAGNERIWAKFSVKLPSCRTDKFLRRHFIVNQTWITRTIISSFWESSFLRHLSRLREECSTLTLQAPLFMCQLRKRSAYFQAFPMSALPDKNQSHTLSIFVNYFYGYIYTYMHIWLDSPVCYNKQLIYATYHCSLSYL